MPIRKNNFRSKVLLFSVSLWRREIPQIAMHVFVRVARQIKVSNDCFQHLEDVRKIGQLVSFLFHQCINVIDVLKFLVKFLYVTTSEICFPSVAD